MCLTFNSFDLITPYELRIIICPILQWKELRHAEVMELVSCTLSEMEFEFELRHPASEFPFLIPVQDCKYVDHIWEEL